MLNEDLELSAMPTPNPNTIKFMLNYTFFNRGSIDFPDKKRSKGSPLIEALFTVKGLSGVFIGTNFVSITKEDDAGWETVLEQSTEYIKDILQENNQPIKQELIDELELTADDDDETIKKIKQILDDEIRPAVATDGGDCQFVEYEDGVLTLQLQGACSTCPSSVMTLKYGIENRLKKDIPDLKDVIQL